MPGDQSPKPVRVQPLDTVYENFIMDSSWVLSGYDKETIPGDFRENFGYASFKYF